jgi:hypothetical protein
MEKKSYHSPVKKTKTRYTYGISGISQQILTQIDRSLILLRIVFRHIFHTLEANMTQETLTVTDNYDEL